MPARLLESAVEVHNWSRIIQAWLYPPTCVLCGDSGVEGRDLCAACRSALPQQARRCTRCAAALSSGCELICGHCLNRPPFFDSAVAAFDYEEPVRHLIRGLKFQARYAYGRLLGTLLAEALCERTDLPDRLLPVPLHPARYRERGFNHTTEIAREVSRRLGVPLDLSALRRTRATLPQVGLSVAERARNVSNAFALAAPGFARHVAVIDDVITTGATVNELARLLKKNGVQRVQIWACARADR